MASQYVKLPPSGGGGGGAVDSVNGQTGVVVLTKSSIGLANVNNTSDADKPISTATQSALDDLTTDISNKQDLITGNNSRLVKKDSSGDIISDETLQASDIGELFSQANFDIEDGAGRTAIQVAPIFTPIEDSPSTIVNTLFVNPTVADTGFEMGRDGAAINVISSNFVHNSITDIGGINLFSQNFSLGNGTDPVAIKGIGYAFGFGQVQNNATIDGPIQGYGFQPAVDAGATVSSYVQAFYDSANIDTEVNGYTSVNLSPQIASVANNNNITSVNINPTIDAFTGNSGFNGLSVAGTYEGFGTAGANFVNVNPTASDSTANYAVGLNVSMDNVTVAPGAVSSLVFQDLTFTFNQPQDNNSFSVQYLPGGTAGSESVVLNGSNIEVTIESGVSTALQIKSAFEAIPTLNAAIAVTVSGTGSNPQVTAGPTNFTGGVNPGYKKAAYLDGDVEITGALSFGGALSIGRLNAFASEPMVDGGGNPASIHSLISAPTVGDNITLTTADTLGINTAMLLTIGANSSVSSAFLGVAALALPAVVALGSGSTIDQVSGGTFAVSLQSGGAGTIDNMDLCRSLALPNGTTTINTMSGYKFDLPFGNPATTAWGFYESPSVNNYFAGNLLIGGTAGSDDTVTNSSVALEVKSTSKAVVLSRMSSSEKNSLTAIEGMIVYDTDLEQLSYYTSGGWVDL